MCLLETPLDDDLKGPNGETTICVLDEDSGVFEDELRAKCSTDCELAEEWEEEEEEEFDDDADEESLE